MPTNLVLLQPDAKPFCGVTDHSSTLLSALSGSGVRAERTCMAAITDLRPQILAGANIFVQASIYGYQSRGIPLKLLSFLRKLRHADAKIVVYFHELWVPSAPMSSSAFWLKPLQQLICAQLAELANFSYFNSPWAYEWGLAESGPGARYVPTFSNVGEPKFHLPLAHRPATLVCFGSPQNRRAGYAALQQHMPELTASGAVTQIVDIGVGDELHVAKAEKWGVTARALGPQEPEVISKFLAQARYGLHYTPWSLATKSGVYGALAAHGAVPISIHERDTLQLSTKKQLEAAGVVCLGISEWLNVINSIDSMSQLQELANRASTNYVSSRELAALLLTDFNYPKTLKSNLENKSPGIA